MANRKVPIYVTQPFLPPLSEFVAHLERIWESKWLTNNGPFHEQLESALCSYLDVKHLALVANGTLGLLTALQALRISGEVITTPFSFVATAHSLLWNGITPVFVDIDPVTMNLDPARIEAAITPETSAILPVHCYGNPCHVEEIQSVADTFGLRVIYDAAHAFGVKLNGESVLTHGDASVLSFHATKVFNTFEGGAIVCPDAQTKRRVDFLKNFGFADETTVMAPGINGKMNEIQAAFGMLQLAHVGEALDRRRDIDATYRSKLKDVPGIRLLEMRHECESNFSYFPIFIGDDYPMTRDELYFRLREQAIYPRRYFYPLISSFPMYRRLPSSNPTNLPVATEVASRVLCLPIYPLLEDVELDEVVDVIRKGAGAR